MIFRKKQKRDIFDGHLTKQGWSSNRYHNNEDGHLTKQQTDFSEDMEDWDQEDIQDGAGEIWEDMDPAGAAGDLVRDVELKVLEKKCDYYLNQIDPLIHQVKEKDIKFVASNICVRSKQILFYKAVVPLEGMRKFLFYYLPVVQDILQSYIELKQKEIEPEGTEIQDLLNTIQHSFDVFVEKLSQGKMIDVEEDISGFEMLMARF